MTYRKLYESGALSLKEANVPEADLDARLLLEEVCLTGRNDLILHGDREVEIEKEIKFLEFISKRRNRIPLQQITGHTEFMGLDFIVNDNVLVPRQDTEILVEEILKELQDGTSILDLCTGSGCILISLLKYSNDTKGVGIDISEKALEIASLNGQKNEVRATWLVSDLFQNVKDRFDLIVSNPPYIPTKDIEDLMEEVKEHEPHQALDGKEDGLFFYREIAQNASDYLVGGGMLFFEIGYDQGPKVKSILEENGFFNIQVIKDYAGHDRVVKSYKRS